MRACVVAALAAILAGCAPQTIIANKRQAVIDSWSHDDAVRLATKECGARGRWPMLQREQGNEYWFSCNETERAIATRRKAQEEEEAKRYAAFRAAMAPPAHPPAAVAPAMPAGGGNKAGMETSGAAKPAAARPAFARGAWVQIGAFRSEAVAKRYIREIRAANGSVFKGHDVVLREKTLGKRGRFHLARLGPFARMAAARHVCDTLKNRGAPCFVVRVR